MLELLEILFENHFCEKVYLDKDHNHHHQHNLVKLCGRSL